MFAVELVFDIMYYICRDWSRHIWLLIYVSGWYSTTIYLVEISLDKHLICRERSRQFYLFTSRMYSTQLMFCLLLSRHYLGEIRSETDTDTELFTPLSFNEVGRGTLLAEAVSEMPNVSYVLLRCPHRTFWTLQSCHHPFAWRLCECDLLRWSTQGVSYPCCA